MQRADSQAITPLQCFAAVPPRFKSYPVRDDSFAPILRCGEFAVVDTATRDPEDGQFILYRSENDFGTHKRVHEAIVRLRLPDQDKYKADAETDRNHPRPWWMFSYGRQLVGNWTPDCAAWAPDGWMHSVDGPICDRNLRECIVGRVVGVMRTMPLSGRE